MSNGIFTVNIYSMTANRFENDETQARAFWNNTCVYAAPRILNCPEKDMYGAHSAFYARDLSEAIDTAIKELQTIKAELA